MRLFGFLLLSCAIASAQTPVGSTSSDATALRTQAIEAAGGAGPISAVHDYIATGTITYYWAGKEVNGPLVVKAKGQKQVRVETVLPSGKRVWAVDGLLGSSKDDDQKVSEMPYQMATNLNHLYFPIVELVSMQSDSARQLTFEGIEDASGVKQYRLRLSVTSANPKKPKLKPATYFVNAVTFEIIKVARLSDSDRSSTEEYLHEFSYSDYRRVNGVLFPFAIEERIGGQKVSTIRFDTILANANLSDSDLRL